MRVFHCLRARDTFAFASTAFVPKAPPLRVPLPSRLRWCLCLAVASRTKSSTKRLHDTHFDDMGSASAEIEELKRDNVRLRAKVKDMTKRAKAAGGGKDEPSGAAGGGRGRSGSGLSVESKSSSASSEDTEESLAGDRRTAAAAAGRPRSKSKSGSRPKGKAAAGKADQDKRQQQQQPPHGSGKAEARGGGAEKPRQDAKKDAANAVAKTSGVRGSERKDEGGAGKTGRKDSLAVPPSPEPAAASTDRRSCGKTHPRIRDESRHFHSWSASVPRTHRETAGVCLCLFLLLFFGQVAPAARCGRRRRWSVRS